MHDLTDFRPRPIRELEQRLRGIGQRVTAQRLAVLSVFSIPDEHLSAEVICDRVAASTPTINRSTVYRTLERFRDLGLISETDLGGGVREYALLDEARHHHLICLECRHMMAFDDALVEPLREQIRLKYGFEATTAHLALFGRCPVCVQRMTERSLASPVDIEPVESVHSLNH